jgi:ABC-type Fe3+/spermidine/putrescine transport system ATPase subunit
VNNLSKTFNSNSENSQPVLSDINFSVRKGECFTIIGPNGSGKSTLLSIMGLLIPPTEGQVIYRDKDITALSKYEKVMVRRNFSFVRQKPLVLDTSVYNNISYGLKVRDFERSEIDKRVKAIIDKVGLNGFEDQNARSLSGGEMQRVAIAMNFVLEPEIYFLDEVSANLDPKNVALLENFINEIKNTKNKTIVMSTHDKMEAIKFSDRIAVLRDGKISQIGDVNEIFTSPKDEYAAVFVGYENVFSGTAKYNETLQLTEIQIDNISLNVAAQADGEVKALIKPESIGLSKEKASETSYQNSIHATITEIRELGNTYHILAKSGSIELLASITKLSFQELKLEIGSNIYLNFKATDIKLL